VHAVLGCGTRPGRLATQGLDGAAVEGALPDDVEVLAALAEVDGDGDASIPVACSIQPIATEVSRPPVGEDDAIGHGVFPPWGPARAAASADVNDYRLVAGQMRGGASRRAVAVTGLVMNPASRRSCWTAAEGRSSSIR
jgi:hypothetical protein